MNNSHWMNKAKVSISQLKSNQIFLLKDLFDGIEWNNLAKGDRLSFGKYFKNEVIEGNVLHITYIGKAQNNSAKYRKED